MATTIKVEAQRLLDCQAKIRQCCAEYQKAYREMYSAVDEMSAAWTGKDNIAFTTQIRSFEDDLQRMYGLMNEYGEFCGKSAKVYSAAQDHITSAAAKLGG